MNTNSENNENWGTCPKCGAPVLLDPATGAAEPCAACVSHASPTGRTLGTVWLLAGIALIVVLVVLVVVCIQMLV